MIDGLRSTVEGLEKYLAVSAIEDRPIFETMEGFAEQARDGGLSLARLMTGWRLLNPQFASQTMMWRPDRGLTVERWRQGEAVLNEDFKRSPIYHILQSEETELRCRIAGANAPFEYPMFDDLAAEGVTDYYLSLVAFGNRPKHPKPNPTLFERREVPGAGIMISFSSDRAGGFTEDEFEAVQRLRYMLALASRSAMERDMRETLAATYLGKETGRRVLGGEIARGEGEPVDAIIWYCDLRGSTALCEAMGAQAYLPLLNEYFEATASPVIAAGGEVLDFIGDAVLAIFPRTSDGFAHTLRATRAACEAISSFGARHKALSARTDLASIAGIAIATGSVVYGNIGVADRLTFSVIGPTVNAVARLERLTKELHEPVLVSEDVARDMAWEGGWRNLGAFALDGFRKNPHVFAPVMVPGSAGLAQG